MSNQLQPPSIATMSVKAYTQEGIRRFRVPMEPRNGFEIFLSKITFFVSQNCVKPIVKWQDSDGDFITIDVIDDFIEAVNCLDKGGTLKVFVNDCTIDDVTSRQSSAAPSLTDIPPTGTSSSANRTSPVPAFSVGSRLADNASLSVSVSPTVEARDEQQLFIEPNDAIPTSQNQRMEEYVQRTTTLPPPTPSTSASDAAAADIFVVAEDNDKGNEDGASSSSETKNDDDGNDNDELPQRSYSSEILQSVFSAIECGALELNEGFRKLETHLKGLESHIYQNLSEKLAQTKEQGYWETSATKTTRPYDDEDNGSGIPAQSHPHPPHHHREHPESHHHRHHRSTHQPHHRHGYGHGQHHQHSDRRRAEKHVPKNVGANPTSKYSSLARDVASSSIGRANPPATNKSILRPLDVKEEATTSKPLVTPSYHTQYPTTASSVANHQGEMEMEMESAPLAVSATNEVTPSSVSRVRDFSVQIQSLKQMGFQESDVYLTDLLWAHGGSVSEVIETLIH